MDLQYILRLGVQVQGLATPGAAPKPMVPTSKEPTVKAAKPAALAAPAANPAAPASKPAVAASKPAETAAKTTAEGEKPAGPRPMAPENAQRAPTSNNARTKAAYMEGTYVFEQSAKLLDLWEDGEKVCVELDQTIFHPQGGGQPSDMGSIEAKGLPTLEVLFVAADKEKAGLIRHDCKGDASAWKAALQTGPVEVTCKVDESRRRLCARLHSAGHLLDVAVHDLGFRWKPGKGYHFPDGPYVEYIMTQEGRQLDNKDAKAKQVVLDELAAKMKELIARGSAVKVSFVEGVRTVTIEGVSCGCGGTHVENTNEIIEVGVKKLTAKQGNMRVSYTMS